MKNNIITLGIMVFCVDASHAATITWSSQLFTVSGTSGQILDTGQFDTSGTQFLAENAGGGANTFDGINWAAENVTDIGFTFTGFYVPNGSEATNLARQGAGSNTAATISLTGLTVGHSYRIQALVYDGRQGQNGRTVSFDGNDLGQYAFGTSENYGSGLLATGTFAADATLQDFDIEIFNGASSAGAQINALLVHTVIVPEPSSLALLRAGRRYSSPPSAKGTGKNRHPDAPLSRMPVGEK